MMRLTTSDPEQTTELGRRLGEALDRPLALLLSGSYGTGKTTFTQGLAQGLGVEGLVRSPSYNILKVYQGKVYQFIHADMYRMRSFADIEELGLTDMLDNKTVIAVEWPGTVEGFSLELPRIEIAFSYVVDGSQDHTDEQEQARVIELTFSDDCPTILSEVANALTA